MNGAVETNRFQDSLLLRAPALSSVVPFNRQGDDVFTVGRAEVVVHWVPQSSPEAPYRRMR